MDFSKIERDEMVYVFTNERGKITLRYAGREEELTSTTAEDAVKIVDLLEALDIRVVAQLERE